MTGFVVTCVNLLVLLREVGVKTVGLFILLYRCFRRSIRKKFQALDRNVFMGLLSLDRSMFRGFKHLPLLSLKSLGPQEE